MLHCKVSYAIAYENAHMVLVSFPFGLSFSLEHLPYPTLPSLLIRLHFASMFSVVCFRALQLSDLYIIWFAIVCERINSPALSSSLFCIPQLSPSTPSTLTLSCRADSTSKIRRLSTTSTLSHLDPILTAFIFSHRVAFPFPDRISLSFSSFSTLICLANSHARPSRPSPSLQHQSQ